MAMIKFGLAFGCVLFALFGGSVRAYKSIDCNGITYYSDECEDYCNSDDTCDYAFSSCCQESVLDTTLHCCNNDIVSAVTWGIGAIVGTVIGVITFIVVLIVICCCCCCRQPRQTVVYQQPAAAGATVAVVNTNQTTMAHGQYPQAAPYPGAHPQAMDSYPPPYTAPGNKY